MDKILVIGCSGLVGGRLMELGKDRYEMAGTYNEHEMQGKGNHKLDTANREGVFKLIEKLKPDCVVDTHSLTNLDFCETHPEDTWKVNIDGSKNVAEACKKFGSKFVFISSDYVFDGKKTKEYTEKDKPHPLCYYAKTKAIVEDILAMLDMDYIVVRSSVIYGKAVHSARVNFVLWLIDKLSKKEKVNIVNDQRNNPTFADSLAEFIFALYEKDERGLFHATGKEAISRYDFSKEVAKVFGLDASLINPISTAELHQVALRPSSVSMSVHKIEKVTKMHALTVKEGLTQLKKQIQK